MTPDFDMDDFVATSVADLQAKQDLLATDFGIGHYARFWLDQPSGTLEFRDEHEQPHLIAEIIPIGSHSTRAGTWMWAWANQSILPDLRERAAPFKALADVTGVEVLGQEVINVEPEMPWELAAMAVRHISALGAYRAPGRSSDLYLAIVAISRVTSN